MSTSPPFNHYQNVSSRPNQVNWPPVWLSPQQMESKRLRRDAGYVGLSMLGLTAGMQLTYTILTIGLCLLGILDFENITDEFLGLSNTHYLMFYSLVYTVAMALPTVLVAICFKQRQFPLSPTKSTTGGVAFFGVLAAVGMCFLANFITSYIVAFFEELGASSPEMPEMNDGTLTSYFLNLFVMAVLPALLEEMIFRGYYMQVLRPYGDWFAVFMTSILFSLMHGNLQQVPFAFLVGLALGWLLIYTNNIWLPVAVHFINNALSVTLDAIHMNSSEEAYSMIAGVIMPSLCLIGVLCLLVLFWRYKALFQPLRTFTSLTLRQRIKCFFFSPALLIAVIILILLTIWSMV